MEELQSTIIELVFAKQLNNFSLSKKCEKLSDLSDGIVLFEFMSKVNHDHFDVQCLTQVTNNNWALRLSNLKKLKKSLTSYTDQVLKLSYKRFDSIDLSGIARKEDQKNILFLLEFVVYATVSSPYKEDFIKKIMELDEDYQTQLMFFIQKSLGEGEGPLFDPNIRVENREVLILRTDKQRLAVQIEELLEEVKQFKIANQKITQERDELQLVVTDLRSDANKKAKIDLAELTDLREIEIRLSEREIKIMHLTNHINELKLHTDREISKLKDELDVANEKLINFAQNEKTLNQYKKRIESLAAVKTKNQELEKEIEELHEQLELKIIEIQNLGGLKKSLKSLKDELNTEKQNNDKLSYKLENLKKDLKKKENEVEDLRQKLIFAETRAKALEKDEIDSPRESEDSMINTKPLEFEEVIRPALEIRGTARRTTINAEVDQYRRENLLIQHKLMKKKEKLKSFKEQVKMMDEEINGRRSDLSSEVSKLVFRLSATTSQLQMISQSMSFAQNDKLKLDQCTYELEQVKNTKDNLINEVKRLYQEKDLTYRKLLECREEAMSLQSTISAKDLQLREKEINEKILNEKLQALMSSEKVSSMMIESFKKEKKEDSGDVTIRLAESEKEIINLKSERKEILFRLNEKDARIEEVIKEKTESIRKMEEEKKETLNIVKEKNKRLVEQIVGQCDDALNELQKEKEILLAQLRIEKKNASQEWKRPMDSGWSQSSKDEINRLREEINKRDKEIVKLNKSNQEVKKCWKDSTRLLKDVWKQIQEETDKIQRATKGYK